MNQEGPQELNMVTRLPSTFTRERSPEPRKSWGHCPAPPTFTEALPCRGGTGAGAGCGRKEEGL